jgi:hypothetical protein
MKPAIHLNENAHQIELSDDHNWVRPHQFNGGLAPAQTKEKT